MTRNLQIVFGYPGEGVPDEEFDRWYEAHVQEILAIPGFVSAQRYRLEPAVADPDLRVPYRRLAVYETEGPVEELMEAMRASSLGTARSYVEYKQSDAAGPPLPEWWDRVRFASWNCIPLGERVEEEK